MSDNEPKKLSNPILSAKLPPPIVGKQANPPKEFAKNPKIGKVGIPKGVKMNIVGKFSNGPPKFPPPQAKVPALSIPKQGIDTNEDGNKVSPPSNQEVKKIIPKRTSSLQGSVLKESMHVKTSSFPSPREISFSNSYDSIPSFSSDDFSSESSLEESSSSDRKKSKKKRTTRLSSRTYDFTRLFTDFENIYSSYAQKESSQFVIPDNDISVTTYKNPLGDIPALPNHCPQYVKEAMRILTEEKRILSYNNINYGEGFCLKEKALESMGAKVVDASEITPDLLASSDVNYVGKQIHSVSDEIPLVSPRNRLGSSSNLEKLGWKKPKGDLVVSQPIISRETTRSRSGTNSEKPSFLLSKREANGIALEELGIASSGVVEVNQDFISITKESINKERSRRFKGEKGIFESMHPSSIQTEALESFSRAPNDISRKYSSKILIKCKRLSEIMNHEMFYFTLSVHDVESRIKLTEDFHFTLNDKVTDETLKKAIEEVLNEQDKDSYIRTTLVPLTYCNPNIYILIRVRTLMKGDIEDTISPYLIGHKQKEKSKSLDSIKIAKLFAKYRQPFAWGCVQLFNNEGKFSLNGEVEVKLFAMKPVVTDTIFYDSLTNPEAMKKFKQLECKLYLDVQLYDPENYLLTNVLDCSLIKYPDYNKIDQQTRKNLVQTIITDQVMELKEFDQHFHQPYCQTHYENNLYIYPISINFTTSKVKLKTMSVRVWLLEDEGLPEENGTMSFYSLNNESLGKYHVFTTTFNEKQPALFDEIKIKLPLRITDKHHLLFQFLAVNTKLVNPKNKTEQSTEKVIGQCYKAILSDNMLIPDGEYTMSVLNPPYEGCVEKLYLNETPTNFVDEDKFTFTFKTRLSSTIYSNDEYLSQYYKLISNPSKPNIKKALELLSKVTDRVIIYNFPVILNQLFEILCNPEYSEESDDVFVAIIDVGSKVFNQTMVSGKMTFSEELYYYSYYHFDNPKELFPYEVIVDKWNQLLKKTIGNSKKGKTDATGVSSLEELVWWILSIIFKSMVLKLHDSGELKQNSNRGNRFSSAFKEKIVSVLKSIHNYRRITISGFEFINKTVSDFIRKCFYIMDRGFVFSLIHIYLKEFGNDKSTTAFRIKFIQSLSIFEHYIPLNMPKILTLTDDIEFDVFKYWETHFLAGTYINQLKLALLASDDVKITRTKAIVQFRNLLFKHNLDDRYQNHELRKRIASIYFPLFMIFCESPKTFVKILYSKYNEKNDDSEFKEWLLCLLWILRNVDPEIHLKGWRNSTSKSNISKFFVLLKICSDIFSSDEVLHDEIVITICHVVDHLIDGFEKQLQTEKYELIENLLNLLVSLFRATKSYRNILCLLALCTNVITSLRIQLFKYASSNMLCGDLVYEIYKYTHSYPILIRSLAISVIYLMIEMNFAEMNQCIRMKLHTTISISKLLKNSSTNIKELKESIASMKQFAQTKKNEFSKEATNLFETHLRIITDTELSNNISTEYLDRKVESIYRLSLEYSDCPELRVQKLNEIAKLLEAESYFEEAAHCRVQIASLISEYLKSKLGGLPESSEFTKISPFLKNEKKLSLDWYEGSPVLSHIFTEDGFTTNLYDAYNLFLKSYNYESAIQSLLWLSQFCIENKKYQNVIQYGNNIASASDLAHKANSSHSRFLPIYYRVGFYGAAFGEENNKEYIYREVGTNRMAEFKENIVKRYEKMLSIKIELLNNKPISQQNISKDKNYIQICTCENHFEWNDIINKDLGWRDKCINVSLFSFVTPYSKDGGKVSEEVDKTYQRKEILTTSIAFPNMMRRVPVVSKEVKILSPIECAIELLLNISTKLKQALNCVPLDPKQLQIILQGSIMTQVNAGPKAIIKTFLANEHNYPSDLMKILKDQMKSFMRLCQFGLRLNANFIEKQHDLKELHFAIVDAFQTLSEEAAKYIDIKRE